METSLALSDRKQDPLFDDPARRVVGQFEAVYDAHQQLQRLQMRTSDSQIGTSHSREKRTIAAVLAHDSQRRRESGEAANGETGPVESESASVHLQQQTSRGTHDPVVNDKNSRRSAGENSDMIERRSRTGRLSIVKPWSAFVELVRHSTDQSSSIAPVIMTSSAGVKLCKSRTGKTATKRSARALDVP